MDSALKRTTTYLQFPAKNSVAALGQKIFLLRVVQHSAGAVITANHCLVGKCVMSMSSGSHVFSQQEQTAFLYYQTSNVAHCVTCINLQANKQFATEFDHGVSAGGTNWGCIDQQTEQSTWADSDGHDCVQYTGNTLEGESWCDLYGAIYKNHGLTANQACCGCGGGSENAWGRPTNPNSCSWLGVTCTDESVTAMCVCAMLFALL